MAQGKNLLNVIVNGHIHGELVSSVGATVESKGLLLAMVPEAQQTSVARIFVNTKLPAPDFARWLYLLLTSAAIIRMIKWKNKYMCNDWEKPINFAPVRNSAEPLMSEKKLALSTYILKCIYTPSKCTYKFKQH